MQHLKRTFRLVSFTPSYAEVYNETQAENRLFILLQQTQHYSNKQQTVISDRNVNGGHIGPVCSWYNQGRLTLHYGWERSTPTSDKVGYFVQLGAFFVS